MTSKFWKFLIIKRQFIDRFQQRECSPVFNIMRLACFCKVSCSHRKKSVSSKGVLDLWTNQHSDIFSLPFYDCIDLWNRKIHFNFGKSDTTQTFFWIVLTLRPASVDSQGLFQMPFQMKIWNIGLHLQKSLVHLS